VFAQVSRLQHDPVFHEKNKKQTKEFASPCVLHFDISNGAALKNRIFFFFFFVLKQIFCLFLYSPSFEYLESL